MRFLDLLGREYGVDDGFETAFLYALENSVELFLHHDFIGPRTHVDAEDSSIP